MRIKLYLVATLLSASACSDPECPDDMRKIGITCFPIIKHSPDGGPATAAGTDGGRTSSASVEGRVGLDGSAPVGAAPDDETQTVQTGRNSGTDATLVPQDAPEMRVDASVAARENVTDAANNTDAKKTDAETAAGPKPCPDGSPNACGACGAVPKEVCDQKDNNCDGVADEGLVCKFWYRDCDSDGFATTREGRAFAETKPLQSLDCYGWTDLEPTTVDKTDCDDNRASRYPGAPPGLPISAGNPTLPPIDDVAYDLNCDGVPVAISGTMSTGKLKQGKLELIADCPYPLSCVGVTAPCFTTWQFSGVPHCGALYGNSSDFECVPATGAYYLCQ